jgi:hypothetical protein
MSKILDIKKFRLGGGNVFKKIIKGIYGDNISDELSPLKKDKEANDKKEEK